MRVKRRRMPRPARWAAASAVLVLVAAGCSRASAPPNGSGGGATSSATTTTTTLVPPYPIAGTARSGPLGFLGSIERLQVTALPPGASVPPPAPPGSPGYAKRVVMSFRSFGSGPDLLLIGGQDTSLTWWEPSLLSALAAHYRVVVLDLPGAGYSGPPTQALSLGWLADEVAGLSSALGLTRPTVLGWGLGGQIALALAERHPGLSSSLVLVDTAAGGAGSALPSRAVSSLLARPGATPVALSRVLFPPGAAGSAAATAWQAALVAGAPDWLTSRAVSAQASLEASLWKSSPLVAGLSSITARALVVSGPADVVFPPANAGLLAFQLRHAQSLVLPSGGYAAILQDEPSFVAALEKFTG